MKKIYPIIFLFTMAACNNVKNSNMPDESLVRLITLDPGHFHSALIQKTMYTDVDSVVHVYAAQGADLQLHLERIIGYNNREENSTAWKEEVYSGNDYLQKR